MKSLLLPGSVLLALAHSGCVIMPLPHHSVVAPRISGRVIDARTSRPVPGASVGVAGLSETRTFTDASGRFTTEVARSMHLIGFYGYDDGFAARFPAPSRPEQRLDVNRAGYEPRSVTVAFREYRDPFGAYRKFPVTTVPDIRIRKTRRQ